MVTPRFEDFAYRGNDDTAAIQLSVASRQRHFVPTGFSSDTQEQRLATFITSPSVRRHPEYIVRATAFSDDNGRESGAMFDALLAEATGRIVVAANVPGVDFYSPDRQRELQRLTPSQLEHLRRGSFRKVGAATMNAIAAATREGLMFPEYIITASSMGAAVAAGMLDEAREKNLSIKAVALAEVVNAVDRPLVRLGAQFANQPTTGGYLAQNPESLRALDEPISAWIERVRTDRRANWRYARAMARGAFLSDIGQLDHLESVPIYLSRGAGSRLSPEGAMNALASKFGTITQVDRETFGDAQTNPHDHPYTMTVQSVIDAVDKVV